MKEKRNKFYTIFDHFLFPIHFYKYIHAIIMTLYSVQQSLARFVVTNYKLEAHHLHYCHYHH
jgi:hypothetical protein